MHFDQQRVGPGRDGSPAHGRDFVAPPGAVRGISGHGQVRQLFDDGDRRNIQRVARISFKSADAALAQNHLVVAARHDVLGGKQQLFQRGRDAALEQHRLAHFAQFAQQIEILHVARAHLQNVHVVEHQRDLRNLHHFTDRQQLVLISRGAQQFERLFA